MQGQWDDSGTTVSAHGVGMRHGARIGEDTMGTVRTLVRRSLVVTIAALALMLVFAGSALAAITYQSSNTYTNTSGSVTVTKPTGTAQNDLLIVQLTVHGGTGATINTPADWTLLNRANNGTGAAQAIFYKVATATEPTTYTFTYSRTGSLRATLGITRYTGVNVTTPIAASSSNNGSSNSLSATGVTAPANSTIIAFYGADDSVTLGTTGPSGMTSRYGTISVASGPSMRAYDQAVGAGTTGAKTCSSSLSASWCAHLVALNPRILTVTATAANKVYDGATTATPTLSGNWATGDSGTITSTSAAFADKNVGTAKPVTVSGIAVSGGDSGEYILGNTTATATANITAKNLTVSGVTADGKIFDGTTAATAHFTSASLVGVVSPDSITLNSTSATATFADKNVGGPKTVTVAGLTLSGTGTGNYTLTQPTATATITAKNLTVSGATVNTKAYNGSAAATVNFAGASLAGVVNPDVVTINSSAATALFNDKHAGIDKPVTVSGVTLAGTDAHNYSVSQPAGLTGVITPKGLTVSGALVDSKTYDGFTSAGLAFGGASLVGVVSPDVVTIDSSAASASFADKNVGATKPVTVTGVALGGASASDYTVSQPSLTGAITPKHISGFFTAADKTYDGTTATTLGTSGLWQLVLGDDVSLTGLPVLAGKAVGLQNVTLGSAQLLGADAGNYALDSVDPTTATVSARDLTVAATGVDKQYDGTAAATATLSSDKIGGDVVTLTYAGASFADAAVGPHAVTVTGIAIDGADAGNYTLLNTTAMTSAIINKAGLTVSFTAQDKTYDGTTAATITGAGAAGVVTGESVGVDFSGATAHFAVKDAGDRAVNATGFVLTGDNKDNYDIGLVSDASATIRAKALTVTAAGIDKVYDGSVAADATLSTDKLAADAVTASFASAAFADKNVGPAKSVSVAGISLAGADAGNYELQNVSAAATAAITTKGLTVDFTATGKTYDGTTEATITGAGLSGAVNGDDVAADHSGATATFAAKGVGTHAVTASGFALTGADRDNYAISHVNDASADITAKGLTVDFTVAGKTYDGTTAATITGAGAAGVVTGEDVGVDFAAATAQFAAKDAGTRAVSATGFTLSGADKDNYAIGKVNDASATIAAKALTVTATGHDKTYDGTADASVTLATDKLAADTVTASHTSATFADKNVGPDKAVSVAGISIAGADAGNYELQNVSAATTAAITKADVTVSFTAKDRSYDGTTDATITGASLSGAVTGDEVAADYAAATATFAAKGVGTHAVTATGFALTGADKDNYTIAGVNDASATIAAKALTVTAAGIDKVYDGTADASVTLATDKLAADTVTASHTSATFADKNVGPDKAVSVAGISIAGADAGNYELQNVNAAATAAITAKGLTVDFTAAGKTYDGTTEASVTAATVSGAVNGDDVAADHSGATATFAAKGVGTHAVTASGFGLTGADRDNYAISHVNDASAAVTAKDVTISFTVADKKYDGATDATITGASAIGAVPSDDVTVDFSAATAHFADAHVGTWSVTATGFALRGADRANYVVAHIDDGTASITSIGAVPTITSPNGGESLAIGTVNPITWSLPEAISVGSFDIWVWSPSTSWYQLNTAPITADLAKTDYSFDWTVAQPPAGDYKVRIWYRDGNGTGIAMDESNAAFAVVTPQLAVTSPAGGEDWTLGSQHTATWTLPQAVAVGTFDVWAWSPSTSWYKLNNDPIAANAAKTSYDFNWTVTQPPAGDYKLRVWYRDEYGNGVAMGETDNFGIVDLSLAVGAPNGGERLAFGAQTSVAWSVTQLLPLGGSFDVFAVSPTVGTHKLNDSPIAVDAARTNYSFPWTATQPSANDYIMRVVYRNAGGHVVASDESNSVFSIQAGLAVTAPDGGEHIAYGTKASLTWTLGSPASAGSFDVFAWRTVQGGVTKLNTDPIAVDPAKRDYTFDWTVAQAMAGDYKIRVIYYDAGGEPALNDASNAVFSIVAPGLAVTAPNGGESLPLGDPTTVTWTLPKALSVGSFVIQAVSATKGTATLDSSPIAVDPAKTSYTYSWLVAQLPAADYTLHLVYRDAGGVAMAADDSDGPFAITSPNVSLLTVTAPNGGEALGSGATTNVTWTIDHPVGAGSFDVEAVSPTQGTTKLNASPIATDITKTSYSFAWTVAQTPASDYKVHIVYRDLEGNVVVEDASNATFTIDPAEAHDLVAAGKYEYVAAGLAGLKIYDVSNPAAPVVVGACDTPGTAQGVTVKGNYAYVADGTPGLQVIDISDPAHPTIATTLATGSGAPARGLSLSSGAVLEDFESTAGWRVDAGSIATDTLHVKHGAASLKVTAPVGVQAQIAKTNLNWDLSRENRSIQMWVFLKSTDIPPEAASVSLKVHLFLSNDNSFSNFWSAYHTIDCHEGWNLLRWTPGTGTDPDWKPNNLGSPSWDQPIHAVMLQVTGRSDRGYEASFDDFRVGVTGVKPAVLWTFDDGYEENYTDVYPYLQAHGMQGTMYAIGNWPGTGGSKITLPHLHELYDAGWAIGNHTIDHSDLAGLSQAAAADKIAQGRDWLLGQGFTRSANFLAFPLNDTSQAAIAAAADAGVTAARQAGFRNEYLPLDEALELSAFPFDDEPIDLAAWEHRIDLAIANGGTLIINAHSMDGSQRSDHAPGELDLFHEMVDYLAQKHVWCPSIDAWWNTMVQQSATGTPNAGHYLYVACGAAGVKVVDIDDPLHPTIVGTRDTSGSATDVATDDGHVAVADGIGGLQLVDASNPAAPTALGQSFTSGTAKGVAVRAGYAYLAEGDAGLRIVNISNPASPVQAGVCDTPGDARAVTLVGHYAYVADGGTTIEVVDVANVASPVIVGSMSVGGQATGIEAWGGRAYVAAGLSTLQVAPLVAP
jgi:peptidoglycan/xylan/chitin deacetylase (PgdA/CDA1 family)